VKADSHLAAHHDTPVTDAGGSAQIEPAEESAKIIEICGQKYAGASTVFGEIPAQSAKLCLSQRPGT